MANKSKLSKGFVWIILGLLFVGLAGFGATNLSGTIRTVATVGDQHISANEYGRDLQREIRALSAQTGQNITMDQAIAAGLDRQVLGRLIAITALDHEVDQIGISIGDENLQREIMQVQAFQGVDGSFDREGYRFALERVNMSEAEFEADLRAETARSMVQGAIVAGNEMPPVMVDTLVNFIGEERSFVFATLTEADLETTIPVPTEDDLRTYYEANADAFTLDETKQISYLLLTPEMLLDQIDVSEEALQTLYDERAEDFQVPERRLVERLVMPDQASADAALAELEAGEITFEALVESRQLTLADIDLGDVTVEDLGNAADPVFAAEVGEVVGPLPTPLGPALFRIGGVLAARTTSLEEAGPDLRDELSRDRARRMVETLSQEIDDLLAGGATLEEVAAETNAELGQIDWTLDSFEGPSGYEDFRNAAAAVTLDDFPKVAFLEDGGIYAMRLDDVLAPRPEPFQSARQRVLEGWTEEATEDALRIQAEALLDTLETNPDFAEAGLSPRTETGLTRTAFIEGTGPDFMTQVFDMEPGEIRLITTDGTVQIVRLDGIAPPADSPELAQVRDGFAAELSQSLSSEIFEVYVRDAQTRGRPQIDQRALTAVQTSFSP